MKFSNPKAIGFALGVGVLTSVAMLPQARGELVLDTEAQPQTVAVQPVVIQPPLQVQPQLQPQTQTIMVQQPVPAVSVEDMSKSELVRRERLRAELKNEDILQERLEELRLRDERRRTDELIGAQPVTPPTLASAFGAVQSAPVLPAVPTTERVGELAMAPIPQQGQMGGAQVAAVSTVSSPESQDVTTLYFQPRAGVSNFNNVTFYDIRAKYSAGLSLGLSVSDNLSFELGYLYSEYGVAMNAMNPWAIQAQLLQSSRGYTGVFEAVTMKQNVADAGLKIHFLGPNAKLRPFIGGGGAYSKSFINADQKVLSVMEQSGVQSPDYDLTQFLGFLSTGFDVRVNKQISIGTTFKYYSVLSSRQNQSLNPYSMYNPYSGYNGYVNQAMFANSLSEADKQEVGSGLSQTSFYSVTGGVSFSF